MKKYNIFILTLALALGCTSLRYAGTSLGQAIDSDVRLEQPWGEVYCSRGAVCTEVEVAQVDVEPRNGGKIQVWLKNRTGSSLIVQVGLQILKEDGTILEQTSLQNVPLPKWETSLWEMPGIMKEGARIRVLLRAAF